MDENSVKKLFNNLSADQQKKIEQILSDKKQTEKILSSPQAKELMKKLMEGK